MTLYPEELIYTETVATPPYKVIENEETISIELDKGKQFIEVPVDLTAIPLFVRAGSIIPMGPARQFTSEQSDEPLEICIYPGEDASFTLYEDEGDNYHYEEGLFSTIELKWDEAGSVFTIGEWKGAFPGMKQTRNFRVVLVKSDTESGSDENESAVTITYNGMEKIFK